MKNLFSYISESVSVWLFVTPWTAACQASLSMKFFRQEYWSGLPFPSPGNLPDPGIEPRSPALQADYLPAEPQGKPKNTGVGSQSLLQRSWPRNQTRISCIARRLFTSWATREAQENWNRQPIQTMVCQVCTAFLWPVPQGQGKESEALPQS